MNKEDVKAYLKELITRNGYQIVKENYKLLQNGDIRETLEIRLNQKQNLVCTYPELERINTPDALLEAGKSILNGLKMAEQMNDNKMQTELVNAIKVGWKLAKKYVVPKAISIDGNEAFLSGVPNIKHSELGIAEYFYLEAHRDEPDDDGLSAGLKITRNIMEALGVTEKELHEQAMKNTVTTPIFVRIDHGMQQFGLQSLLDGRYGKAGVEDIKKIFKYAKENGTFPTSGMLILVTTPRKAPIPYDIDGAAGISLIRNDDISLKQIADMLMDDLAIAPMCTDRLIVMPLHGETSKEVIHEKATYYFNPDDIPERIRFKITPCIYERNTGNIRPAD